MRPLMLLAAVCACGALLWFTLYTPKISPTVLSIESPNHRPPDDTGVIQATLYVILSPECPVSNGYLPKLNRLQDALGDHRIEFVGVVPASSATADQIDSFREKFQVRFPVVLDHSHQLCRQLGVTHTPQAILVDNEGRTIYSGRIDDRFSRVAGQQRQVSDDSLQSAIDSFLAGTPIQQTRTDPVGCRIEQPPTTPPVDNDTTSEFQFTRDVAPILLDHCSRCHRPGELAPFSLLTYEDAVRHASQIRELVELRLMPPWKPVPEFGRFKSEHRLTDREIEVISAWTQSGMARGPAEAMPSPPEYTDGWQLGTPDLELIMPESFNVPADGPDIYQHFIIPTGLTRNRLVSAFEFRPGTPEVVHHAFAYFDTTGRGRELDAEDPGPGYSRLGTPGFVVSGSLGGWGPGRVPHQLPLGMGRPLAKASDLVVQIHYHPSGRPVSDQSRIGLYFAEDWAHRLVTEVMVCDVDLAIPKNVADHPHRAEWTLPVDTLLINVTPHMHVLGRKIQAVAYPPDGTTVPLIRIDDWDFYWQDSYTFEKLIELPAGTRIVVDCQFDNSAANPQNPNDPPQDVYWGDFSQDEMGICYFQATTKTYDDYITLNQRANEYFNGQWQQFQEDQQRREVTSQ